jgi:hypothetical protein
MDYHSFVGVINDLPTMLKDKKNDTKEMDEKHKLEFEKSLELRKFEIENFWKRGWFFGALLLALFTGYFNINRLEEPVIYPVFISFIAMLISLIQSLMNRGSKYWQERWEYKTKNRESLLEIDLTNTKRFNDKERYYIDACILSKNENELTVSRRISVSKLTFLVWDIITISCALLWINDVFDIATLTPNWPFTLKVLVFYLAFVVYGFFFIKGGSIGEALLREKDKKVESVNNQFTEDCESYILNKIK